MKPGDKVRARDAFGRILDRIVVAVERPNIFICREEEYAAAQKEDRDPICIGFKAWDVTDAADAKFAKTALSRHR